MKIKSVTVGNYKNVPKTTIEFERIVSLVSTNNYGKSNILEAIAFGFDFINASPSVRNQMMKAVTSIPLSPSLAGKDFIFSIEFNEPGLMSEYRFVRYGYKFAWLNDQGTGGRITSEIIEARANESIRYSSYLKRDKGKYRSGKGNPNFKKINLEQNKLAIDVLSAMEETDIADIVKSIQSLSYRACNKLDLKGDFNPALFDISLNPNSTLSAEIDLPRALNNLRIENKDKYELFLETIYELFPEFNKVELNSYSLQSQIGENEYKAIKQTFNDSKKGNTVLPFRLQDEIYKVMVDSKTLNQPLSVSYMSMGTKRIFWLVANAIFAGIKEANLVEVDEIETSIHPKMIKKLLEALSELLEDASMIVTSHSPYLIQYLKQNSIYIGLPNEEGLAVFRRIHRSKTKALWKTARLLGMSEGEYIFDLISGNSDSAEILSAYMETVKDV